MSNDLYDLNASPDRVRLAHAYSFARLNYARHMGLEPFAPPRPTVVLDAGHLGDDDWLEDIRTVPVRNGSEPFIAASPINGFTPNEIERWIHGATVVPRVDVPQLRRLALKTLMRLVRGMKAAYGDRISVPALMDIDAPLPTITSKSGGSLVVPTITRPGGPIRSIDEPLGRPQETCSGPYSVLRPSQDDDE